MRFLQILEKTLFLWRIETITALVIQVFWESFRWRLDCLKRGACLSSRFLRYWRAYQIFGVHSCHCGRVYFVECDTFRCWIAHSQFCLNAFEIYTMLMSMEVCRNKSKQMLERHYKDREMYLATVSKVHTCIDGFTHRATYNSFAKLRRGMASQFTSKRAKMQTSRMLVKSGRTVSREFYLKKRVYELGLLKGVAGWERRSHIFRCGNAFPHVLQ